MSSLPIAIEPKIVFLEQRTNILETLIIQTEGEK